MLNLPNSFAPHADFDPAGRDWRELYRYRIPREPGKGLPALNEAWHKLFRQPVSFEHPQFEKILPLLRDKYVADGACSYQKIGNWCGAIIAPDSGTQFALMFGEWTLPKLSEPPVPMRLHEGQASYHCVTWIGFDGNRRYFNSSLPQVGIEQILIANGSTKCSAWFQWWARDQVELTAYRLQNLSIKPGTTVMAMIWAYRRDKVCVAFRACASEGKDSRDKLLIFTVKVPEVLLPGQKIQRGRPQISGATAEWIMERPQTAELESAIFLPFPQHEPVRFSSCVAGLVPIVSDENPRQACSEKLLLKPRLIRLFEPVPDRTVARTQLLSLAQRLCATSIEVSYCGGLTEPREITELAMHRQAQ